MIKKLKGVVETFLEDGVILMVGGIGFFIHIPLRNKATLVLGKEQSFFVEMICRSEQLTLFGFLNDLDLQLFNMIGNVQGIGPKTALNILSYMDTNTFRTSIMAKDEKNFKKIPGFGPKMVQRLITELSGSTKFLKLFSTQTQDSVDQASLFEHEALLALEALGFEKHKVFPLIQDFKKQDSYGAHTAPSTQDVIKFVLMHIHQLKGI